jgi:hypothetical protein
MHKQRTSQIMKKKIPNKPTGPPEQTTVHILPDEGVIPTIGSEAIFYGQIIGLSVGLCKGDLNAYALFLSDDGKASIWIVPDHELFLKLSDCLNWMNKMRTENGTDYGWNQLWIGYEEEWETFTI